MEIKIDVIDDVQVAHVSAVVLDASNAQAFKGGMQSALQDGARVVLDMSELDFVDSSGLGAMLSCLREATGKGGGLKVCGINKKVRALLELVRFHRILDIYNTVEEAVKAFNS